MASQKALELRSLNAQSRMGRMFPNKAGKPRKFPKFIHNGRGAELEVTEKGIPQRRTGVRVSMLRNAPCVCGKGKAMKDCHVAASLHYVPKETAKAMLDMSALRSDAKRSTRRNRMVRYFQAFVGTI